MDAFLLNFVLVLAVSQAHQALEELDAHLRKLEGRPEARVRALEDENVSLRESRCAKPRTRLWSSSAYGQAADGSSSGPRRGERIAAHVGGRKQGRVLSSLPHLWRVRFLARSLAWANVRKCLP
jgi:hypothetical protein